MSTSSDKKIRFILSWYGMEKRRLSENGQLKLLNKWIKTCSKFEEYEMSNSLLREKIRILRNRRVRRIGERTLLGLIVLHLKILRRKWLT